MAYMPKGSDISEAVDETKDNLEGADSEGPLEAELHIVMKTEVQSAVRAANREVLRTTVEETRRDIFLNSYESAENGVKDSSYHVIKYVLTHLVAARTIDSILELNFHKRSRMDAFMDAIAYRIASSPKFLELIMTKELDGAANVAGSKRPFNTHDRHRSMSPPQRTTSDSGRDSSDGEAGVGHSFLMTETM